MAKTTEEIAKVKAADGSEFRIDKSRGSPEMQGWMPRNRPPKCRGGKHERPVRCDCCSCKVCFACHELMPCEMHRPFFLDQLKTGGIFQ